MRKRSSLGAMPFRQILYVFYCVVVFAASCLPSRAEDYVLDTGDVLRISVFGEPSYPLEITVDDRGAVSLPLLGDLRARGFSPAKLAEEIKNAYQAQSLLVDPFVQVDIRQYRPFFITGAVTQPGSYPYRPGMTIRHALAVAGGFKALSIGNTDPALVIADLRAERAKLVIQEFAQQMRLRRLQAERQNSDSFSPKIDAGGELSKSLMDSIVSSEQDQFRSRELAFETDLAHLRASLDRSKKDAQSMANAHRERQNAADSQLKQLQTSRLLKQKGLVTDYNLLTLEQAQNTYRVAVNDAEVEQARADQDIMNLEKAISTKKADRELDLIAQTEQAELDLAQTQSNLRYVRDKLVFVSDYGQHKSLDDLHGSVRVTIYRDNAEVEAIDTSEVRAGDVIEVSVVADTQFYSVAPIGPTN